MAGVAGNGMSSLNLVTGEIHQTVGDVEIIFIPLPGFTVSVYAKLLAPFLRKEQIIVLMPGTLSALEFRKALGVNGNAEEPIIAETGKQAEVAV